MEIKDGRVTFNLRELSEEGLHEFISMANRSSFESMHLSGAVPDEYAARLEASAGRWDEAAKAARTDLEQRLEARKTMRARAEAIMAKRRAAREGGIPAITPPAVTETAPTPAAPESPTPGV